jgi:hypothetical protein
VKRGKWGGSERHYIWGEEQEIIFLDFEGSQAVRVSPPGRCNA